MASTRELWILLRARDEASRVVHTFSKNVRAAALATQAAQKSAEAAAIRQQAQMLRTNGATAVSIRSMNDQVVALEKQARAHTAAAARAREFRGEQMKSIDAQVRANNVHASSLERQAKAFTLLAATADQNREALIKHAGATDEDARAIDNQISMARKRAATLTAEASVIRGASASMIAGLQQEQTGLDGSIRRYERRAAVIRAQAAILRNAAQEQGVNLSNQVRALTNQAAALDRQANSFRQAANAARNHDNRMKAIIGSMAKVSEAATVAAFSLAAIGAGGMLGLKSAIDTAVAYERQVRSTATQVDGFKGNLKELGDMGKRIGNEIGVSFEQIQPALFDIFSSMEVGTKDAEKLLRQFAKAAVAGQVDIQDVSRATIGLMNAFHRPVSDVNKLLDMQFQLVKEGIGTYEEWNQRIGLVTPSAVRAGQSIEMMMAALATATRMGISAARAGTSVARAMDAMSHPAAVKNMEALGIKVREANGKFRPMNETLRDFRAALLKLPEKDRVAKILEVFKGAGGTIEARRFLQNILLGKQNLELFDTVLKSTSHSAGSMQKAYALMADTTATKSELVHNKWMLLKTAIGDALIPQFNKLLDTIAKGLDWFNQLPESTKKTITQFILWGSVIALVLAGLFAFIAIAAVAAAAIATIGGAAAIAIVSVALLPLALVALGAAFISAYKSSENFRNAVKQVGDNLKQLWGIAVSTATSIKTSFESNVLPPLQKIGDIFTSKVLPIFRKFQGIIDSDFIPKIREAGRIISDIANTAFKVLGDAINNYVVPAVSAMADWWDRNENNMRPLIQYAGQIAKWLLIIAAVINGVLVVALVGALVGAIMIVVGIFQLMAMAVSAAIDIFKSIPGWFSAIGSAISGFASQVGSFFSGLWATISSFFTQMFQWFSELPGRILAFIQGIPAMLGTLFTTALNAAAFAVGFGLGLIYRFFTQVVPKVASFLAALPGRLGALFMGALAAAGRAVSHGASAVVAFFRALPGRAASAVSSLGASIGRHFNAAVTGARTSATNLVNGFINFVHTLPGRAASALSSARSAVLGAFSGAGSWLLQAGRDILNGAINGIGSMISGARDAARRAARSMVDGFTSALKIGSPSRVFRDLGYQTIRGLINGITGSRKSLQNAMAKITHDVMASLKAGKASKAYQKVWSLTLSRTTKKLLDLEAKRASITSKIASAQKSVNDQIKARADLYGKIRDKLSESADILDIDARKPADIKKTLSQRLTAIQEFSRNILALKSKGLNKDTIAELATAGVDQAGNMAKVLANASTADIQEINRLQANIRGLANATGNAVAGQMYDAGIKAAQGLVKGLQSQEKAITKTMTAIANALIASIKKSLGIHSPSRVFEGIGINTALGYMQGYKKQMMRSSMHSEMLAYRARPGYGFAGATAGTNSTGKVVHQSINVYTNEIDPRRHAAELGWELEGRIR